MNKTPALKADSRRWLLVVVAALAVLVMTLTFTLAFTSVTLAQSITLLPGFNDTVVTSSLRYPTTAMAFAPDGRLFIAEGLVANTTIGAVRVVKDGVLLPTRFVTVEVRSEIERGLTGIAIDPNFATNHYVYVRYTAGSATADPPTCRHTISRFTADGDVAAANSQVLIADLGNCLGTGFHNAGALHFGIDGKLYTAIGDQNSCSSCAQSLESIFGKLLRFNPDGNIPTDNPFYNSTTGLNRSIWAMGLRNPFNFAVQPGTGRIHINDVGGRVWEEINVGQAGANYGWPTCESDCSPPNPNFTDPLYAYNHDEGCAAITGGVFYNPSAPNFPNEYIGKYFFMDWCRRWIKVLDPDTGEVTDFVSNLLDPSTALAVGPDGALYVLGNNSLHKIQYTDRPAISQQPNPVTVNEGELAIFEVVASGNPPLSYQWQRNAVDIPGATSSTYSLTATLADNGSTFKSIVTNASGSTTSESALLTVRTTANYPPVGTITKPGPDAVYRAGDTITFSGNATDPEDGELPLSALSWDINLHHNIHFHDYIGPLNGVAGGSFTLPVEDETDDNVWYRINLTVTDADGSTHTSYRDVMPLKSTITVATDPPGLQVTLEGQPVVGPHSTLSVEALQRTLGVVSPQTLNGVIYEWVSWSDGGAATHTILTPIEDATYTAVFAERTMPQNDLFFGSTPILEAAEGITYTYVVTASSDLPGALLTISAPVLPNWLDLSQVKNGEALLSGVATKAELGEQAVTLLVTNTHGMTDTQSFTLTVVGVGQVEGVLFDDENENGTQDEGEAGVAGAIVSLTPTDGNSVSIAMSQAVITTTTNASGVYLFTNVPTGSYTISFDLPDNRPNPPSMPITITSAAPEVVLNVAVSPALQPPASLLTYLPIVGH
jgi:glucose/arabinose dehydrogenase/chitodextrinase